MCLIIMKMIWMILKIVFSFFMQYKYIIIIISYFISYIYFILWNKTFYVFMQFTLVYFSHSIFVIVNSYILDFLNHNHFKMLLWSDCFHTRQLQGPLNTWACSSTFVLVSLPHIFIQGIDAQPIVRVAGLRWVTGENWLGDWSTVWRTLMIH